MAWFVISNWFCIYFWSCKIDSIGLELLFPLYISLIGCSILVIQENGVFSNVFPNQDNSSPSAQVQSELSFTKKEEELGDAWAKLEHSMLSKELEEE